MFQFGQEVKDKITGFRGVITGQCSYITGCQQYLIQPKGRKTDVKPDALWFDVDRLALVSKKIISIREAKRNGADLEAPTK